MRNPLLLIIISIVLFLYLQPAVMAHTEYTRYLGSNEGGGWRWNWGYPGRLDLDRSLVTPAGGGLYETRNLSTQSGQISVADALRVSDIIVVDSSLGSGRNDSLVASMYAGFMAASSPFRVTFEAKVRALAREVASVTQSGGQNQLIWQFGNEVQASAFVSNTALYFNISCTSFSNCADNSIQVIPYYIEYYLLNSLDIVKRVAAEEGAQFELALGSAGTGSAASQAWIMNVLDYTIQGFNSSSHTGKRVSEVLDYFTIQYLIGPNNAQSNLNYLQSAAQNRTMKGFISTEDLGIKAAQRGDGPAGGLNIFAEVMNYVVSGNIDPHAYRLCLYASNTPGPTSANSTASAVFQAIRDTFGSAVTFTASHRDLMVSVTTPDGGTPSFTLLESASHWLLIAYSGDKTNMTISNIQYQPSTTAANVTEDAVVAAWITGTDLFVPYGEVSVAGSLANGGASLARGDSIIFNNVTVGPAGGIAVVLSRSALPPTSPISAGSSLVFFAAAIF